MEKDEKLYFNYLVKLVKNSEIKNYILLLERLWDKEYYGIIPNDQNREKDGIFLRQDVINDDYIYDFGPCSVLEMLIGLSRRMEFELFGSDYNKSASDLFWEMLENLNLLKFNNLKVLTDASELELDYILTTWLDRKYYSNGEGSIFPLKRWSKEIHEPLYEIEIWYQMMLYLSENYQI